jgi:hypothetical protein
VYSKYVDSNEKKGILTKTKNLFTAKELIDWILALPEYSYLTRDDASQLCESMRITGIISSEKKKQFSDDTTVYRFEKANVCVYRSKKY